MDFTEHVIISTAGCAALAMSGTGWESAAAFGVMGVFIDLDHFPDYWRENGWELDLPPFFDFFSRYQAKKLVVALHAWEWIALAAAGAFAFGVASWVGWGIAGWLLHLILD